MTTTMQDREAQAVAHGVSAAQADPNVRTWLETTNGGHQGDVLIERLRGADLEAAVAGRKTHRGVDRALARGSRAAHVVVGDATVWESTPGVLLVEARATWALVHTDVDGHRHHPHVLPAGWYRCRQQQEETPAGVVAD